MSGKLLTEVDFDQIKQNLIDYLKSTKSFTDYDFNGSNLQVILNLIAYQQQINAHSTNMVANEAFLSSATLRDTVVANARTLGYLPTSERSSFITTDFQFNLESDDYPEGFPKFLSLQPGPLFMVSSGRRSFTFHLIEEQVAAVNNQGECLFSSIVVYEGAYLTKKFTVDKSNYNQKFIIENSFIDTTTIRVEVQEDPNSDSTKYYRQASNLVELNENSRVFFLEEVDNGNYELNFGDGYFGKALLDRSVINVSYVVSNGDIANGVNSELTFIGTPSDNDGVRVIKRPTVLFKTTSEGGSTREDVSSIKLRAPKHFGAQKRCVTVEDYEALVRQIYPGVDDVYVFGGEILEIPEYGRVYVVIKPTSGDSLSNTTKNYISKSLDNYRIASLDIRLVDPEIVYIEVISTVYYDNTKTLKDASGITTTVRSTLSDYSKSSTVSKFGGSIRYSRIVGAIDDSEDSITRNNTSLRMRRDMKALIDTLASYEVCFENPFKDSCDSSVVYSSGFKIQGDLNTYYFEDDTKGNLYTFYFDQNQEKVIVNKEFGTVDYEKGEVQIGYQKNVRFTETVIGNEIIEIRAIPRNQDIIASKTVYLDLDVGKSDVVSTTDTEISGS